MRTPDRAQVETWDVQDPLAGFRDRFQIADPDLIYMDGNSLGRLPTAVFDRISSMVEKEWGGQLVRGWHSWIDLAQKIGNKIGTLIGARDGEVIISDSTTVNLYKLASAALDAMPQRKTIVFEQSNFPSDLYVFQALSRQRSLEMRQIETRPNSAPQPEELRDVIDKSVALVSFSHINYQSGAIADMRNLTEIAHTQGALTLWDLCHSAGSIPMDLDASQADLAVGCTYKYLCGGPGSPAFLFVREDLQTQLHQPIWGWFGHSEQFAMESRFDPSDDIRRFIVGTPPVLSLAAVEAGVDLLIEAGMDRLREKSIRLTELVIDLADRWLAPLGFEVGTPRDPQLRGSHVALRHEDAWRINRALIERYQVIPDFREPDIIRYATPPAYTRFVDAFDAMERLRDAVSKGTYLEFEVAKTRIT